MLDELEVRVREALINQEIKECYSELQDPRIQQIQGLDLISPEVIKEAISAKYTHPDEMQIALEQIKNVPEMTGKIEIFYQLAEIMEMNYKQVGKLTQIAREKGIDEVIKKEDQIEVIKKEKKYAVIREIFHNPEEYKEFNLKATKLSSELKKIAIKIAGIQIDENTSHDPMNYFFTQKLEREIKEIF